VGKGRRLIHGEWWAVFIARWRCHFSLACSRNVLRS
jgi:hypothetical protein